MLVTQYLGILQRFYPVGGVAIFWCCQIFTGSLNTFILWPAIAMPTVVFVQFFGDCRFSSELFLAIDRRVDDKSLTVSAAAVVS